MKVRTDNKKNNHKRNDKLVKNEFLTSTFG